MRFKALFACAVLLALTVGLNASPATAADVTMPVLRVTFNGKFKADMSYVNGQMQLTDQYGQTVSLPAKFKTRGATASEYMMKPSFNMKLRNADYSQEQDSALLGMRSCSSWILDAMAIDRICMRNRVAFDIWNDFAKLPYETQFDRRNGTEGRFVEVYINDEYYGIYCMTDRINRKLLDLKKVKEHEFGPDTVRGVLYKSGTQDLLRQEERSFSPDSSVCVVEWHNAWELSYPEDHGGMEAWSPLLDMFDNGQSAAYVKKYFVLQNIADYEIHVMALSIVDNWGNKNHFFSIRNITKSLNDRDINEAIKRRVILTPWDLDTSLGGDYNGSCYGGHYTDWPLEALNNNAPYPVSALVHDQAYLDLLRSRWFALRGNVFSTDSVNAKLERYRDLFIQSGAWNRMVTHYDHKSNKPKYVTDLAAEIELIEAWYANRFQEMDEYFNVTALEDIPEEVADNTLYDLLGRKLGTQAPAPGAYIRNGKVVIITNQ